ncbi:MAG: hypothetical protein QOJ39_1363, partial [Candidatus Eremiobacteraeota bacterium]|nr:hypothetical protein [Candidatus Eremiobacteraeota bacterium]
MTDKATRRNFIDRAVIATSALAAAELIPFSASGAPSSPAGPAPGTQKLRAIGEITSEGGKLRAVITVKNAKRTVPTPAPANLTATDTMMLRYFDGHRPDGSQQWPPNVRAKTGYPAPGPGPTLRAKLGDQVQIALLNHVRPTDFRRTLDVERCDHVRNSGTAPAPGTTMSPNATPPPDVYPRNDHYPDCLHGSSSANIHFHGTHVTPSTTGDNVLINVRPNRGVLERDVLPAFDKIWNHCEVGHQPLKWGDLPRQWRDYQRALLIALPEQQLWHDNEAAIAAGVWPQWHVGAYPYCFQIPHYREGVRNDVEMGQSPGTHWYHSHKHGSTAINMFNGLSGAFIITDDSPDGYDGKLHRFYAKQGRKLTEHVLVFQQIIDTPNMLSNSPSGRSATLVNGQYAPVIDMQPGDVQLWRMINANVSNIVPISFTRLLGGTAPAAAATPSPAPSSAPASSGFTYKQTAQDGVQLGWDNY